MKRFFMGRTRGLLVLAAVLALVVAVAAAAVTGHAPFGDEAVGTLLKPFRYVASTVTNQIGRLYDYTHKYDQLEAENQQLRERIADMEEDVRGSEENLRENERLRALLNLSQSHADFVYEPAYISAWSGSNWTSSFTINKGSGSGISEGMCAVTELGQVVGLVTEVGYQWSTVTTILDSSSEIGASVASSGYTGIAQGKYQLSGDGELRMSYLSSDAVLKNGDQVLTTGSGDLYPKGLILGYVADVGVDETGVAKYAVIDPAADFNSLEQIFIIKQFDIEE